MVGQFEWTAKQRIAEARELQEGVWIRETELQKLREKYAAQKAAFDELTSDLENCKVWLRVNSALLRGTISCLSLLC